MKKTITALIISTLASLSATAHDVRGAQDAFFDTIASQCGKAFSGVVTEGNASDDSWRESEIVLHIRDCDDTVLKMPMHVGDNRSRTFVLTKIDGGLWWQHDHRHEDGISDKVTMYGGKTTSSGTANRQDFPAGDATKKLFTETGLTVSLTNTWTFTIEPGDKATYMLTRPGRLFQITFDLTKPVPLPPAAWGYSKD